MTPAAYVASKCGKVNVVLLGLISDESDMFRDGTFKGVSIEPVAECVATAYDYFCAQGENDGGSSGSRRGRMKEHQWPLPRQPGEKSESETKRSKQPAYKRQTRDNNVAAAAVIPLTHETMVSFFMRVFEFVFICLFLSQFKSVYFISPVSSNDPAPTLQIK